jgi:transcriptional regulator with XRE-family HTH domain
MAAGSVDEKRLRRLLAEGKSQREIATALKIPRSTLQRIIKELRTSPSNSSSQSLASVAVVSPPVVDTSKLAPAELEAVRSDFWEMIGWWRERKARVVNQGIPRDTTRATYHVERRFVELIRHEAETEDVSITEVVNRALRAYFEGKRK